LTIVSLNRFERKKNIGLAIEAFALLKSTEQFKQKRLKLVIAGGYDVKVTENVEHLNVPLMSTVLHDHSIDIEYVSQELKERAKELGVLDETTFAPSISTKDRDELLGTAL